MLEMFSSGLNAKSVWSHRLLLLTRCVLIFSASHNPRQPLHRIFERVFPVQFLLKLCDGDFEAHTCKKKLSRRVSATCLT